MREESHQPLPDHQEDPLDRPGRQQEQVQEQEKPEPEELGPEPEPELELELEAGILVVVTAENLPKKERRLPATDPAPKKKKKKEPGTQELVSGGPLTPPMASRVCPP